MTINEKAAYLKGLMEGLQLDTEKAEGKMIAAIVDLLGDVTKKLTNVEDTTIAISDELDEIEEDLDAIEDFIMDMDEEDEDEEYDFDEDEDEDGFRCVMCPACGEKIYFDESMDPSDLICPACGKDVCGDDEDTEEV